MHHLTRRKERNGKMKITNRLHNKKSVNQMNVLKSEAL